MKTVFHIAFPVDDLEAVRKFYGGTLGFEEGRSADTWIDYNCYGHQIVAHLKPEAVGDAAVNAVDGHGVPVPHFGAVLPMDEWEKLAERLKEQQVEFVIEPYVRFKGKPGEQATLFIRDPSGNALEFKAFQDFGQIFAK